MYDIWYIISYYTILYYTILYYIILYHIILYYIISYYIVLYCVILYRVLLYIIWNYTIEIILYHSILYYIHQPVQALTAVRVWHSLTKLIYPSPCASVSLATGLRPDSHNLNLQKKKKWTSKPQPKKIIQPCTFQKTSLPPPKLQQKSFQKKKHIHHGNLRVHPNG